MAANQISEDKTYFAKQGNKYQIFLVTEEYFFSQKLHLAPKKKKKEGTLRCTVLEAVLFMAGAYLMWVIRFGLCQIKLLETLANFIFIYSLSY